MSAALDFTTLSQLAGNKAPADAPCPLCGPERSTRATQRKPVLRIWKVASDFLTYSCARCGEHGHASVRHGAMVDRRELARRLRAANEHQAVAEAERRGRARWLWSLSLPMTGTIDRAAVHAVHLTRLLPDGSGKAPDTEGSSKIMVGVTEGWPIALIPPNDAGGLAISEGIEDALSLHQVTGLGCWASGAAVRLPKLARLIARLPYIESLLIAQDDDRRLQALRGPSRARGRCAGAVGGVRMGARLIPVLPVRHAGLADEALRQVAGADHSQVAGAA